MSVVALASIINRQQATQALDWSVYDRVDLEGNSAQVSGVITRANGNLTNVPNALNERLCKVGDSILTLHLPASALIRTHIAKIVEFFPKVTHVTLANASEDELRLLRAFPYLKTVMKGSTQLTLLFNVFMTDAELQDYERDIEEGTLCPSDSIFRQMYADTNTFALTSLHFNHNCKRLSDNSLEFIATCFARLRRLSLTGCEKITDTGLACLKRLRYLTHIELTGCALLTREAVEQFIIESPSLQLVIISQ